MLWSRITISTKWTTWFNFVEIVIWCSSIGRVRHNKKWVNSIGMGIFSVYLNSKSRNNDTVSIKYHGCKCYAILLFLTSSCHDLCTYKWSQNHSIMIWYLQNYISIILFCYINTIAPRFGSDCPKIIWSVAYIHF